MPWNSSRSVVKMNKPVTRTKVVQKIFVRLKQEKTMKFQRNKRLIQVKDGESDVERQGNVFKHSHLKINLYLSWMDKVSFF